MRIESGFGDADWGVAAAPSPALQQSATYGAVAVALGAAAERLRIVDGTDTIGHAQVVTRAAGPFRLAVLNRGPVWSGGADPERRRAALRLISRRFGTLIVTPEERLAGRGLIPLMTPRWQASLDLTAEPALLRARMKGKWRNRLAQAERSGLRVRDATGDRRALKRLLALERVQARERGYRGLPAAFVQAWAERAPQDARLFEGRAGGETVAAMLFLIHGVHATYQAGWCGVAGREASAHHLTLWQAMLALRGRGIVSVDLGDVNTDRAPGLARFKLGSGAVARPLGATMLILPARGACRQAARTA